MSIHLSHADEAPTQEMGLPAGAGYAIPNPPFVSAIPNPQPTVVALPQTEPLPDGDLQAALARARKDVQRAAAAKVFDMDLPVGGLVATYRVPEHDRLRGAQFEAIGNEFEASVRLLVDTVEHVRLRVEDELVHPAGVPVKFDVNLATLLEIPNVSEGADVALALFGGHQTAVVDHAGMVQREMIDVRRKLTREAAKG